jgi:acetyl esterase/lipase
MAPQNWNGEIGKTMKRHLFLLLAFGLSFNAACNGKGETSSNGSEKIMNVHTLLTTDNPMLDVVNHPAFKGFGERLLPRDNNTAYYTTQLNNIYSAMPYSNISPALVTGALNRMIDEVNGGKTIFYDFYTPEQKGNDPSKENTGLFFFRGNPNAPFAVVCPGGAWTIVGSFHEGFPIAIDISEQGYNVFVIRYRIGGERIACEDLAAAIGYIFENAETLKVNTKDYSLWGESARARMAARLSSYGTATYGEKAYPKSVTAVIAYTAHSDYTNNDPPTFTVTGERDGIAPPRTMERRVNAMKAAGMDVEFHVFPNAPHGFDLGAGASAEGWVRNAVQFWERYMTNYN